MCLPWVACCFQLKVQNMGFFSASFFQPFILFNLLRRFYGMLGRGHSWMNPHASSIFARTRPTYIQVAFCSTWLKPLPAPLVPVLFARRMSHRTRAKTKAGKNPIVWLYGTYPHLNVPVTWCEQTRWWGVFSLPENLFCYGLIWLWQSMVYNSYSYVRSISLPGAYCLFATQGGYAFIEYSNAQVQ